MMSLILLTAYLYHSNVNEMLPDVTSESTVYLGFHSFVLIFKGWVVMFLIGIALVFLFVIIGLQIYNYVQHRKEIEKGPTPHLNEEEKNPRINNGKDHTNDF